MPTKRELLSQAEALGIDATDDMSKAELEGLLADVEGNNEADGASVEQTEERSADHDQCWCGEEGVRTDRPSNATPVSFCAAHVPASLR